VFFLRKGKPLFWLSFQTYLPRRGIPSAHFTDKHPDQPEASCEEGQKAIQDEFSESIASHVYSLNRLRFTICVVISASCIEISPRGFFGFEKNKVKENMKGRFYTAPHT
jgi:hypothetical protein